MSIKKAAALSSYIADALALGVHWIYDQEKIHDTFGRVTDYVAPGTVFYHASRPKGGFTHYGDQAFVLLESLAANKGFVLEDFFKRWVSFMRGYDGYMDAATRQTLERVEFGEAPESSGSNSHDLAGASRLGPLVACYGGDEEVLVATAKAQTRMTHNNSKVIAAAEFFARVIARELQGKTPVAAMREAAALNYEIPNIAEWVKTGLDLAGEHSVKAVAELGPTCDVDEAFPATVQLIASHENDLENALIDCVMGGGDSSARAMMAAPVLAANPKGGGMEAIPTRWIDGLVKKDAILEMLESLKV